MGHAHDDMDVQHSRLDIEIIRRLSQKQNSPIGCRECGELKFHAPYCKINLDRCGTHSITMQTIRDSERAG